MTNNIAEPETLSVRANTRILTIGEGENFGSETLTFEGSIYGLGSDDELSNRWGKASVTLVVGYRMDPEFYGGIWASVNADAQNTIGRLAVTMDEEHFVTTTVSDEKFDAIRQETMHLSPDTTPITIDIEVCARSVSDWGGPLGRGVYPVLDWRLTVR